MRLCSSDNHYIDRCIQRELEASILVLASKLSAQKSFLVQYILTSVDNEM